MDMPTLRPPTAAAPRPAVAGRSPPPAGGERLAPALGAMVRLFCARFMPEVEPAAPAQDLDA